MGKEKKEIWKLLELLNEYQNKYIPDYPIRASEETINSGREILISKKYWFISWLVENDKIDTDAYKTVYSGDLDKRKTLTMSSGWDEFYQVTEHWVYESLLMLLSISDTPIEDLLLYLK